MSKLEGGVAFFLLCFILEMGRQSKKGRSIMKIKKEFLSSVILSGK